MPLRMAALAVQEHGLDPHPSGHRPGPRAGGSRASASTPKPLAYLTMALGAASVTPMQMAVASRCSPRRLPRQSGADQADHRTDDRATCSTRARSAADESARTLEARNAFLMTSLLQEVTAVGHGRVRQGEAAARRHLR